MSVDFNNAVDAEIAMTIKLHLFAISSVLKVVSTVKPFAIITLL